MRKMKMNLRTWFAFVCLAFVTCAVYARKVPDSAWQKAIVKDIQLEQRSSVSGIKYGEYSSLQGGTYTVQRITIDTLDMLYEVYPLPGKTAIMLRKGKLDLIVNSSVEYAIDKGRMSLRDSHGNVGEFQIAKKTLKSQQ